MLHLQNIYNLSNGTCILSCVKEKAYNFKIPHTFNVYVDFSFHSEITLTGVVMGKHEWLSDLFEYIDLNTDVHFDKSLVGRIIILVPINN